MHRLGTFREHFMPATNKNFIQLQYIKQSHYKSLAIQTTKLTYVDSEAESPRNIARKQVKNGITNAHKPTSTMKLSALVTDR